AADLGQPPANAGVRFDEMPSLLDAARGPLAEEFFPTDTLLIPFALRLPGGHLTDAVEAAFEISAKTALNRAARAVCQPSDVFVGKAVMLQPEDLHVPLHTRLRMVIAVVGNGLHLRRAEGNLSHDRPPSSLGRSLQAYGSSGPL